MNLTDIAGVVIDLDAVPSKDEPAGSHVRYTGDAYDDGNGNRVRRAEMVAGPAPAASDESEPVPGYDFHDPNDWPDGEES